MRLTEILGVFLEDVALDIIVEGCCDFHFFYILMFQVRINRVTVYENHLEKNVCMFFLFYIYTYIQGCHWGGG